MTGGAEGFRVGGTEYSAEHFATGGTGAEDASNLVVGAGVHFGAEFFVCFVNFYLSPPCVVYLLCI